MYTYLFFGVLPRSVASVEQSDFGFRNRLRCKYKYSFKFRWDNFREDFLHKCVCKKASLANKKEQRRGPCSCTLPFITHYYKAELFTICGHNAYRSASTCGKWYG
jgi:hypothetical protein